MVRRRAVQLGCEWRTDSGLNGGVNVEAGLVAIHPVTVELQSRRCRPRNGLDNKVRAGLVKQKVASWRESRWCLGRLTGVDLVCSALPDLEPLSNDHLNQHS